MPNDGIVVIGGSVIGYTTRNVHLQWDISPDFRSDRKIGIETPFRTFRDTRYITHEHIAYIYATHWIMMNYDPIPITERKLSLHYKLAKYDERWVYYYPDTRERLCFCEGLFTQTPLLMKYPKYFNWNFIPQIINPEFIIWSFYDLDEDDITLHIIGDSGVNIYLNSGVNKDKFKIEKIAEKQYKITVYVEHIFELGELVTCFLTVFDIRGNYLKPGMW